jgi:molybdopterin/thiamine biosynthesis adenylyltransferase
MLRNIRAIAVIGCGGIGSWLLPPFLRFLNAEHFTGEIHIWDGDHFSSANAERQAFDPGALGLPKAEAQVEHFKLLFPALRLREHNFYVTNRNVHDAVNESMLVISCVDNHPARALIERRAIQLRDCCVLSAGNERYDGNVHVLLRAAWKTLTVPSLERHPEIATARGGDRATLGCEALVAQGETQLLVTNFLAAAAMLAAFHLLWNYGHRTGRRRQIGLPQEVFFDAASCAMSLVTAQRE